MGSFRVAKISEFSELKPIFASVDGFRVGVYQFKGKYYAYANQCPHQEGPACEGIIVGNKEAELLGGGRFREYTSEENMNIVCPWHGVEFDLESGFCRADTRYKLRSYDVIVEDDEVLIIKYGPDKS
jgi:nitrite reductase/ring-hydroxylating ferredoxin subunit